MAQEEIRIRWGEDVYTGGQLTAADMIAMEDEWGLPFPEIPFESMKAACWLVWLVRRHEQPDLTFEAVTSITLNQLTVGTQDGEPATVPPTSGSSAHEPESEPSGTPSSASSSE